MKEIEELEDIQLDLARMRERMTEQMTREIEDFEIRLSSLRHRMEAALLKIKESEQKVA